MPIAPDAPPPDTNKTHPQLQLQLQYVIRFVSSVSNQVIGWPNRHITLSLSAWRFGTNTAITILWMAIATRMSPMVLQNHGPRERGCGCEDYLEGKDLWLPILLGLGFDQ